ncbi:MAG: hypothetical protein FJZ00_11715 [Candidatus Sericytochromatia bacterium]|uniref:DUF1571 domain-containing protein n=1 Tax=Candidatus Tanganyikabacteria bacterium TaxID=2961651 RepID=A0A937X4M2_9BACT|nr:hypothetical protein [Candidatus Tanganyikabacteria bacterium]
MKRLAILAATVVCGLTAACGGNNPVIDDGKKLSDLKITPTSPATGSATPGQDPLKEVAELRKKMAEVWARNNNLRADVTLYVKNLQSGTVESAKLDYWFQKPNSTALYLKEHSKTAANGTKMVWQGGDKVAIKTKFIGFWVKTSLPESDDRLKDARGDKISDTSVPKMMQCLTDPAAQVAFLGRGKYKNRDIVQFSLKSKYMIARVDKEHIAVDTGNFLPVVREMYEAGGKLTYRLQLEGIKINVHEPKAFELD